jgi:hypothetical protein
MSTGTGEKKTLLLGRAAPISAVLLFFLSLFMTIPPVLSTGADQQNFWVDVGLSSLVFAASRVILVLARLMTATLAVAEVVIFGLFSIALAVRFSAVW